MKRENKERWKTFKEKACKTLDEFFGTQKDCEFNKQVFTMQLNQLLEGVYDSMLAENFFTVEYNGRLIDTECLSHPEVHSANMCRLMEREVQYTDPDTDGIRDTVTEYNYCRVDGEEPLGKWSENRGDIPFKSKCAVMIDYNKAATILIHILYNKD